MARMDKKPRATLQFSLATLLSAVAGSAIGVAVLLTWQQPSASPLNYRLVEIGMSSDEVRELLGVDYYAIVDQGTAEFCYPINGEWVMVDFMQDRVAEPPVVQVDDGSR
jgi:hypothetical protein